MEFDRAETERRRDSSKRSAMVSSPRIDRNVRIAVPVSRGARTAVAPRADYCGGIFTHAATRGLLAGTGLRQVADRSVGMTAAFRLGPQYAVKSISSALHCTVQFVAS